ncbi:hypothetical protein RclHR1_00910003 [Rhizophagus clarus]|uniref:Transient receptor potential cation channel subfamily V member 1-like n=1 Tax=Rhizophagus clarus TaxID=94130 RepID=A0A2Z6S9C7_9GLOM|nr:hypothetical protein RclHR1_00910003 [Rhizophagus clarus]GES93880.1 transient receptor potential cation channel subfamily V member 1-like [Rhizophagus clarus]
MNDDIETQEYNSYKKIINDLEVKSSKIDESTLIKSLENCKDIEEIQTLENLVHKLVNSKVEDLPCYDSLKKLIDLRDEKSILEFFDYCAKLCIEEEKLELMCEVTVLFQDFINIPFYKSPVSRLIKQLTYVKVPSKWCEINEYQSENENLYGYKIHNPKIPKVDRYQTIPQHHATLCYLPLPGLFSYPDDSSVFNVLFPHKLSPFAKFLITYPDEIFQANNAYSEIIDSPLFLAIVKFKWRTFARYHFFMIYSFYLLFFAFFVASIQYDHISALRIICTIMGAFQSLCVFRYGIVMCLNGVGIRFFTPTMFLTFAVIVFPAITAFMALFLELNNSLLILFRALSMCFLWIGAIEFLVAFRRIGIFIIVVAHICREVLWLLIYLVLVIFAASHGTVVYSNMLLSYKPNLSEETYAKFQELTQYSNSLNAYWSAFLSDYSLWPEGDLFIAFARVAYSLFITVVILNLMIALVNNVYTEVLNRVYTEWAMVRAQIIVIIELATLKPSDRQNRDYFPWTIFYKAFTEDVERWQQKLEDDNIAVSRDQIQLLNEMTDKMKDEIVKLKDDDMTKIKIIDKINELKQLLSKK